jgi:hypothetical protein
VTDENTEKKPEKASTDPKTLEKAVNEGNIALEQRIMNVMKDVFDAKIASLEKAMDEKIDTLLKTKEVELEQALRKGFGLENDPVIHMSDMIAYGRKQALEKGETDKRTPAPETPAGPDGNVEPNQIDELFKKAKTGALD